MPKKPCHCSSCKGTLRDPKTIKTHANLEKVEAFLTAKKVWRKVNEDARRRAPAAESEEVSSGERDSGDEGSAGSEEGVQSVQRPQKRCRTDDLNTQFQIKQEEELEEDCNRLGNSRGPLLLRDFQESDVSKNREYQLQDESDDSYDEDEGGARTTQGISEDEDRHGDIPQSRIENIRIAIKNATLGNGKLDPAVTERLRHLDEGLVGLSDPDLRFSLDLYMSCINESQATYNSIREAIIRRYPQIEVLSHHRAKKIVADISGVVSVARQEDGVLEGVKVGDPVPLVGIPTPSADVLAPITNNNGTSSSGTTSKATAAKKGGKLMKSNNSTSARNLFAIEYLKTHPGVTTNEFKVVYDALDRDTRKKYELLSRETKKGVVSASK